MNNIVLSTLGHVWLLDLDGTIVKHNGYKIDGADSFLPGAKDFLQRIPEKDMVVFLTSRDIHYKTMTESFLNSNGINYTTIIYNAPFGERIIVNDRKPSGLDTAYAINLERDSFIGIDVFEDVEL